MTLNINLDNARNEIVDDITINVADTQSHLELQTVSAEKERIELDGRKAFFKLRDRWSFWIILWISVFIIFHIGITVFTGLEWLNFKDHQWLVPSIVVENFLQIVGMGYIVIKFLYPPEK